MSLHVSLPANPLYHFIDEDEDAGLNITDDSNRSTTIYNDWINISDEFIVRFIFKCSDYSDYYDLVELYYAITTVTVIDRYSKTCDIAKYVDFIKRLTKNRYSHTKSFEEEPYVQYNVVRVPYPKTPKNNNYMLLIRCAGIYIHVHLENEQMLTHALEYLEVIGVPHNIIPYNLSPVDSHTRIMEQHLLTSCYVQSISISVSHNNNPKVLQTVFAPYICIHNGAQPWSLYVTFIDAALANPHVLNIYLGSYIDEGVDAMVLEKLSHVSHRLNRVTIKRYDDTKQYTLTDKQIQDMLHNNSMIREIRLEHCHGDVSYKSPHRVLPLCDICVNIIAEMLSWT
jgi:hypothetical protein